MTTKTRFRLSALDIATVVVLASALFLIVRPGSALYAFTSQWMTFRRMETAATHSWPAIISVAQPLYDGSAPPDVVIFSDYQCPFCRAAYPAVDSAVQQGARIAIVHFPLKIHPPAKPAARAAICAQQAGGFRRADHWLMTNTTWQTDTSLLLAPRTLGVVDSARYVSCFANGGADKLLAQSLALIDSLRIAATPTIVSEVELLRDAPTTARLLKLARGR